MSNRLDRLRTTQPIHDPRTPPPGARLALGSVAARLSVTVTEMAEHCAVSRRTLLRIFSNEWPESSSYDLAVLRDKLTELLEQRGATDDELIGLFWAAGRNNGRVHTASGPDERGIANEAARPAAAPTQRPRPFGADPDPVHQEFEMLIARQTLTPQARRHFQMLRNPFEGEVVSDDGFFSGGDVGYVRETAWQCAILGGFTAIVGESGSGKTTIVADVEARIEREGRQVQVIRPSVLGMEPDDTKGKTVKAADILHAICTHFAPGLPVPQTLQGRTTRAKALLTASVNAGNRHLLLIEEGHSIPDATLKHLKRLHEVRHGRTPLLGILLAAQPELKHRLARGLTDGSLREVAQRLEVVELLPLDADLKPYLECRAQAAGKRLADLLDDKACDALADKLTLRDPVRKKAVSVCYPLVVHNLLTKALNAAAEVGAGRVTADLIKSL